MISAGLNLKVALVGLIIAIACPNLSNAQYAGPSTNLRNFGVVPTILDIVPKNQLLIFYTGGQQVYQGNQLYLSQVVKPPVQVQIENADPAKLYTLFMLNPDAPANDDPVQREYLHWLIVDIPGKDLQAGRITGTTIASYEPPEPQTGDNRYVFAVYEQRKGAVKSVKLKSRNNFSVGAYTGRTHLTHPVGANFFTAQPNDQS